MFEFRMADNKYDFDIARYEPMFKVELVARLDADRIHSAPPSAERCQPRPLSRSTGIRRGFLATPA